MSNAPTLATTPPAGNPPAPAQQPRAAPETIPGYENMSFEQRRLAQDQNAARRR
jgi:hypothetical protein